MTFSDLIELSIGNLWRMKLRAFLTIAGVIIAIAAFVAMLSFGAGNRKLVTDTYTKFGLFTSMKVYPRSGDTDSDTIDMPSLDMEAVRSLSEIPGVNLAYPFVSFNITAELLDTQITTRARAFSIHASKMEMFSKKLAGTSFSSDSAKEVIVMPHLGEILDREDISELMGQRIVISVRSSTLDSAIIGLLTDGDGSIFDRLKAIRYDSLFNTEYREHIMRRELSDGLKRFLDGFMNRQVTISETLTVVGIGADFRQYRPNLAPIIIPEDIGRKFSETGYSFGSNPVDMLTAMQTGDFFIPENVAEARGYPQVTLDLDPYYPYKQVKDSVEALGFRAHSFAEEFEEIQTFFLYYNIGLGVIGLIALVTAALGIVNTMVMSIIERRREIGVIKSLGAGEGEIRLMFLAESGVIGMIGSVIGIICGWTITRIISIIAKTVMERREMPVFELFALPLWLILLTICFGLGISLIAGFYPASRAARIDPVEALRSE